MLLSSVLKVLPFIHDIVNNILFIVFSPASLYLLSEQLPPPTFLIIPALCLRHLRLLLSFFFFSALAFSSTLSSPGSFSPLYIPQRTCVKGQGVKIHQHAA